MSNHTFTAFLARHNAFLEQTIQHAIIPAENLKLAMHYSLFPGGKRMRPLIVYLCGELLSVELTTLDAIAASIELMHTYSLVHDDLPAMDNDDYRRGKPSCHRAFDEATAILVGDGLQTLAIDVLLQRLPHIVTPQQCIAITQELLRASGPSGMLAGQSLDLSALQNNAMDELELIHIHQLKTGRLILACVNMVLSASQATNEQALALRQFAERFSQVFQMQDDYLDRYDTQLGKNRASDLVNNKLTFAACINQETLYERIYTEFQQTLNSLNCFATAHDLRQLVISLLQRSHPSKQIA